jgi:hypothetical protein
MNENAFHIVLLNAAISPCLKISGAPDFRPFLYPDTGFGLPDSVTGY